MPDLNFASTDEVIAELAGRFDYAVFAGVKVDYQAKGKNLTKRTWYGNSDACSGLATSVATSIWLEGLKNNDIQNMPEQ